MKIGSLASVLVSASLFSGVVAAQEGTQDFQTPSLSSRTRAEVIAELEQARAAGRIAQLGESYGTVDSTKLASTRTRAEVLAEFEASRRVRVVDGRSYAASYGSFRVGEIASTRSRAEVMAELVEAQKVAGGLSRGERAGS